MNKTIWTLRRGILAATFTLGALFLADVSTTQVVEPDVKQFKTVEDTVRDLSDCTKTTCTGKIAGKTAIPAGMYEVRDTWSPKFQRKMLELVGVPGFQGIRIHSGNDAEDTEGCLVLGNRATPTGVAESKAAMIEFNAAAREVLKTKRLFIQIKDPPK